MRKTMCGAAMLALVLAAGGAGAQEKPPTAAPAPTVPAAVTQEIGTLQVQVAGLAHAQQLLQKEIDAETAQFQRAVQQAQAACAAVPGYELGPSLACVHKAVQKKDESKKDSPPK